MLYNENTQKQWVGGWIPQLQDFDPANDDQGRLPEEPHLNHYDGVSKICQLIGEYDLEGWTSVALAGHALTGPALAVGEIGGPTDSVVFAAWPDADDDRLHLAASTDSGATFIPAPETGDFSDAAPALAGLAGEVCLAWKGSGNQQLNVAVLQYTTGGWGSPAIGARVGVDAISDAGPALAVHRGQLVLAWKGVDNGAVNVAFWESGTPAFRDIVTLDEVTIAEPALVSHEDRLLVAWAGSDHHVNIAELPAGSSSLTGKITLQDTTQVGPALTSFQGRLFLALQLEFTGKLVIMASDDGGSNFADRPPRTPPSTALTSALAGGQDSLFWAWTEGSQEQVNVGRYLPPPGRPPVTPFGAAFNRTETNAGIMGTDLGNQFMHGDRMCFLFGDTAFTSPEAIFNLDTIAFADISDFDPGAGLALTFNPSPPVIAGMRDSQKVYSVPLDGITIDGTMYLFYSLDSIDVAPNYLSFGHTDVVKSVDNGFNFTHLYEFSREHFLNVSVAQVQGSDLGLPEFGDTLAVWGTGIYHSSEPYLAALPVSAIETGQPVRYFAGVSGGATVWADNEDAAAPVFQDPTVAELSVRFNSHLNAWMMMYTSLVVHGVCLRLSATPWGPWTTPVRLQHQWFNPPDVSNQPSSYIHVPNDLPGLTRRDWMYDADMPVPPTPATTGGIPYSPAIIEPLIQGGGAETTVFYTMSTWSPYTSLLMRADLNIADLAPIAWPPGAAGAGQYYWLLGTTYVTRTQEQLTAGQGPDADTSAQNAITALTAAAAHGIDPVASVAPTLNSLAYYLTVANHPDQAAAATQAAIAVLTADTPDAAGAGQYYWLLGNTYLTRTQEQLTAGQGPDADTSAQNAITALTAAAAHGIDPVASVAPTLNSLAYYLTVANHPDQAAAATQAAIAVLTADTPDAAGAGQYYWLLGTTYLTRTQEQLTAGQGPDADTSAQNAITALTAATAHGIDPVASVAPTLNSLAYYLTVANHPDQAAAATQAAIAVLTADTPDAAGAGQYYWLLGTTYLTRTQEQLTAGQGPDADTSAQNAITALTAAAAHGIDPVASVAPTLNSLAYYLTVANHPDQAAAATQAAIAVLTADTPDAAGAGQYYWLLGTTYLTRTQEQLTAGQGPDADTSAQNAITALTAAAAHGIDPVASVAPTLNSLAYYLTVANHPDQAAAATQAAIAVLTADTPDAAGAGQYYWLLGNTYLTRTQEQLTAGQGPDADTSAQNAITALTAAAAHGIDPVASVAPTLNSLAYYLTVANHPDQAAAATQAAIAVLTADTPDAAGAGQYYWLLGTTYLTRTQEQLTAGQGPDADTSAQNAITALTAATAHGIDPVASVAPTLNSLAYYLTVANHPDQAAAATQAARRLTGSTDPTQ